MADDINALLERASGGGSLPAPVLVNPLAAINTGQQLATHEYQLRDKQAQHAWGQILQQSTDENGNVDYPKAQRLAAGTPAAAMGMMSALKDTSGLRGGQINNTGGHMALLGMAAMTVAQNPSDANVNASFDNLIANGVPRDTAERERARWLAMPPAERQQNAFRVGLTNLSGLQRVMGLTTQTNVGGQDVPVTVQQPTPGNPAGTLTVGPGGVNRTVSPDTVYGAPDVETQATPEDVAAGRAQFVGQTILTPRADIRRGQGLDPLHPPAVRGTPGVVDRNGVPASPANPPRLLRVPGAATPPAAPGASPAVPAPQGNVGFGAAIGGPQPLPVPPPAPPPPPVVPPRPQSALEGGVPVASVNPLAPELGPAAPPSSAVQGNVNAILAGMDQARAMPRGGTQTAASVAIGAGPDQAVEVKSSGERLAADRQFAADYHSTQLPFTQALKNYGEGTVTGPGADFWTSVGGYIRTPLAKIGVPTGPLEDAVQRAESLKKWLANIQANSPAASRSDAMLAQTMKGSASTSINDLSGEDMVKVGVALNRMQLAPLQAWDAMSPQEQAQHGTYLRYRGKYSSTLDPRAFAIDLYNPTQIKHLREQISKGSEEDARRFKSSLELVRRLNLSGSSQAMP